MTFDREKFELRERQISLASSMHEIVDELSVLIGKLEAVLERAALKEYRVHEKDFERLKLSLKQIEGARTKVGRIAKRTLDEG